MSALTTTTVAAKDSVSFQPVVNLVRAHLTNTALLSATIITNSRISQRMLEGLFTRMTMPNDPSYHNRHD
ncbi:MAG: hypothetical protein ACJ74Y_14395 [Bryobacteraceae bacterium]